MAADGTFLWVCDAVRSLCLVFLGHPFCRKYGGHISSVISDNIVVRLVSFRPLATSLLPLLSFPLLSQVFPALCRGNPAGMLSLLLCSKIPQHLGCASRGGSGGGGGGEEDEKRA